MNSPAPAYSFTTKNPGLANVLTNEVSIAQAFTPNPAGTLPPRSLFRAIWDTGATNSVVTENVIKQCGLIQIDITKSQTPNGVRDCKVFLVSVGLPNKIIIPQLRVTDGTLGRFDVLIGMDIISMGDFAISNYNGNTVFTFRMPSLAEIDFNSTLFPSPVAAITEKYPGTHRNARCPCGSGRKYKNCCMNPV